MPALITRCPACATMFKVVPDQLRVSEGWVRCGHCGEVFDASAHLQPFEAVVAAQQSQPTASDPDPPTTSGFGVSSQAPGEQPSELPSDSSGLHSEVDEVILQEEVDPAELAAQAQTLVEDPRDRPFALRREDLSGPGELLPSQPQSRDFALEGGGEPTFVRQARRQARWQHPARRAMLLLAVLALAGLLALQVAVHERDRLAAAQPGLRPALAILCAPFGCRIAPPRQIDAIAIDSSSFNKLRPEAYRLQVTLKNQARTAVAMPALELTLTDSDEQPVVRRVLLPADLAAGREAIAAGSDWSGMLTIGLADNSLAGRIAGYRLLAFYP